MTIETLYDALEICLQSLEQGADLESCLVRFPALAADLRPILETATQARSAVVADVPEAAMRRSRARVLQAAAEMREQAVAPRKTWQFGRTFRLALASLAMIVFLLTGGTGLVSASAKTIPGDNLYPVKRSWEDVQLFFVFDQKAKVELENHFDEERVEEINELFSEKRMEQVNFEGIVQTQGQSIWQIDGLRIAIEHETVLRGEIVPGALVQIVGETDDGIIKAQQISLITAPVATFTPNPTSTSQATSTSRPTLRPTDDTTEKPGSITEVPEPTETPESMTETPEPTERKTPEARETSKPKDDKGDDKGGGGDDHGGGGGGDG